MNSVALEHYWDAYPERKPKVISRRKQIAIVVLVSTLIETIIALTFIGYWINKE
jgi:hypothetical protein